MCECACDIPPQVGSNTSAQRIRVRKTSAMPVRYPVSYAPEQKMFNSACRSKVQNLVYSAPTLKVLFITCVFVCVCVCV